MINMNIFRLELKNNFLQMLIWTGGISFLIIISLSMYTTMLEQGAMDQLKGLMETPMIARLMEGFGVDFESLQNILGFYVSRNVTFTMLLGSIFAIMLTSGMISKEESDKTIEYLFSKPVTRNCIFNSKYLAANVLILTLNILVSIVGYTGLEIFKTSDYNTYAYFVLCIYNYMLIIFFSSAGILLAAIQKRGRVPVGLLIGLVLGFYFWDIISKILRETEFIGWFTPFKYIDLEVLRPQYDFEFYRILFFAGFFLIFSGIAFYYYRKKDFYI